MTLFVFTGAFLIFLCREDLQKVISNAKGQMIILLVIGIVCMIFLPIKIGFYIAVKLEMLTVVSLLIVTSMKQSDILYGLTQGFRLRGGTARMLMLILDFIPKIYREKKRGRMAQRARGVDPFSGKIFEKLRKEMLLAIPDIKYAYARSKRQYEAMDKRQFISSVKRNGRKA
jgi:energy-coupling factor transporter transmembrane protein EcfT